MYVCMYVCMYVQCTFQLEPAVFKLRVLIGQRVGSNFHSIPRENIVSRAFVSRGNNSNCFHGKQFWPSLAFISLMDSKLVRCVARVTTRFRESQGPSSTLAALGTLQPGPPRLSKTHSYPCSASNLYVVLCLTQRKIFSPESGPIVSNRPIHSRDTKRVASEGCGHLIRARRPGLNRARNPLSSIRYVADSTTGHV